MAACAGMRVLWVPVQACDLKATHCVHTSAADRCGQRSTDLPRLSTDRSREARRSVTTSDRSAVTPDGSRVALTDRRAL